KLMLYWSPGHRSGQRLLSSIVHRPPHMRVATQPVEIRAAEENDLPGCVALDDSYVTAFTWQMEIVRGEAVSTPYNLNSSVVLGESPLSVIFRPMKLPRPRKVLGPVASVLRDGNEAATMSRL